MEIKVLTEQNPWWLDKDKINQDEKVKEALSRKHQYIPEFSEDNILIVGPRQVGKTTYLKLIIKNLIEKNTDPRKLLYFSCEPLKDYNQIIEIVRLADILISGKKYFFFDEITFVEDWQRAIKYILDSNLAREKVFYITGSSSLAFKKETFPGRNIKIKEFLPLSFSQFCRVFGSDNLRKKIPALDPRALTLEKLFTKAKDPLFFFEEISYLFNNFLKGGGFLRSAYELMEGEGIRDETHDIYWKWLVSDIAKIERSERITRSVLISVLKNYASKFSLNSVASEMEIGSHVTIREYLELLENLFVLRNIFPFDFKKKTELFRKMRKVYFTDPFLFTVFKKILTQKPVEEEEIPKIIEGIVGEFLFRKFNRAYYFSSKKEIDFFVNNLAIEVKWKEKAEIADFGKIRFKNNIILSKTTFKYSKTERVLILPTSLFLLLF